MSDHIFTHEITYVIGYPLNRKVEVFSPSFLASIYKEFLLLQQHVWESVIRRQGDYDEVSCVTLKAEEIQF